MKTFKTQDARLAQFLLDRRHWNCRIRRERSGAYAATFEDTPLLRRDLAVFGNGQRSTKTIRTLDELAAALLGH